MDEQRILAKIDEMMTYLEELESIKPREIEEYTSSIKDKRACERLLQMLIETEIDICSMMVFSLKLGLPSDEEDLFSKLESKKVITKEMKNVLSDMKGMRNILVHRYGEVKDEKVFEAVSESLEDLEKFREEVLKFIKSRK